MSPRALKGSFHFPLASYLIKYGRLWTFKCSGQNLLNGVLCKHSFYKLINFINNDKVSELENNIRRLKNDYSQRGENICDLESTTAYRNDANIESQNKINWTAIDWEMNTF